MKRLLMVGLLLGLGMNSFGANWDKIQKRATQVGAGIIVADKIHEELDPQRKAAKEEKKKKAAEKARAENSELESKIAGVFMAASGQEPSAPDAFAASYIHTLKQRYNADYKARYKSLAKSSETNSKFNQVYNDATMRQIMSLPSKEAVRQAMDSRYPMLF